MAFGGGRLMTVLAPSLPVPVSPVVSPSVADVLRRAADLLEEFGWCQAESMVVKDGFVVAYCAGRAYLQAHRDLGTGRDTNEGWDDLRPLLGLGDETVSSWNLRSSREEVVARLRAAADAATA